MAQNSHAVCARGVARTRGGFGLVLSSLFVASAAGLIGNALVASPHIPTLREQQPESDHVAAIPVPTSLTLPKVGTDQSASDPDTEPCNLRWFDERPIRPVRTIRMRVTAYSPDEQSCGEWADGVTASGYSVWTNGMNLVAADTSILPFGSLLSVPGYDGGSVVPVLDRGGAIKGTRLDVLFPTHERALEWGVQELEVTVWEYADGAPQWLRR
jgi:3D (Asp-Asp-Asp) domain-containing protein